ncbi:MAG TPA: FixH family protein, partial [Polyangiaceae bacterium]|nr:FixH family protein [Polyangiaceae bacterium]
TQLVAAEPAPPARGRNVWTLTVTDAAGVPMPDVAIKAKPSMPDHAHSADTPTITPMGGGTFRVEGLLFFMGGVWQVQFEVYSSQADQDDGGAPIDRVDYLFCI